MALKPHGFIPVVHAATKDRPDEIDTLISAEAVAAALAELGFVTEVVAVDLDLNHFHALKRRDPLLVFNLVDAVRGDGRLAPVIPSLLDAVGLPTRAPIPMRGWKPCPRLRPSLSSSKQACRRPASLWTEPASIRMRPSSSRRCGSMARLVSTKVRW